MGVVLELPADLRAELKAPLGPIYTDTEELLADVGRPVIAVGDIVTHHLLTADHRPDVAIVDGKTKRERVERQMRDAIEGFDRHVTVENPPATLTEELLEALESAVGDGGTTAIVVEGEEDLAALPAVLVAPEGAVVVYGQPDEGMVLGVVDEDIQVRVRDLLERMTGEHDRAWDALGVE